jgi:hypothetical protein
MKKHISIPVNSDSSSTKGMKRFTMADPIQLASQGWIIQNQQPESKEPVGKAGDNSAC